MTKAKKKRASKYDKKLAIDGTFADVIKVSVKEKEEPEKPKEKKKPGKKTGK